MKQFLANTIETLRIIGEEESAAEQYEKITFHRAHPRAWRVLHALAFFAVLIITTMLLFHSSSDDGYVDIAGMSFAYYAAPLVLFSGIGSFIPTMLSFFSLFLVELFSGSTVAYSAFAYLIAICAAQLLSQAGWYRRFSKTLISIPIMSVLLGSVWFLIAELMNAHGFGNISVKNLAYYLLEELPECAITAILLYLWFRFVPHDIRRVFQSAIRLSREDWRHKKTNGKQHYISRKIATVIIVEAIILTTSAAAFSNILINEMGSEIIYDKDDTLSLPEIADPDSTDDTDSGSTDSGDTDTTEIDEITVTVEDVADDAADAIDDAADAISDAANDATEALSAPPNANGIYDRHIREAQEAAEEAAEDMQNQMRWQIRMRVNNHGMAFILRLMMMLANMAIPIVVFANVYAQMVIASPLKRMARAMRHFSEAKDEKRGSDAVQEIHELNIHTKDEIEQLYHSMNEMVDAVVEHEQHLIMEQKLEEDLRVAERASQSKSDFLSSMSHEIRTPINAVLGLDEMILREAEDDQIVAYASDIQNAGHSLLSLVNDILDFSKIEAGKMEIIPVEYDLASTINDLVNMIRVRAEAKSLSLVVDVDKTIPHLLYGDEIRIKQVVTNILTNAVKYTESGSVTMTVRANKVEGTDEDGRQQIGLFFSVKDTGIGMKPEDLEKLYSPFERIEEKRNRSIEGTGLGMSIVKQLLDKMGTKLNVTSVYGEGSKFSFTVTQGVLKDEPIGDYTKMYEQALKSRQRYHVSFTAPDAKILIVDDTRMNLTVVCALLKRTRIQIDTALSGKETLEMVQKKRYDMIFLDHMMPEMDGIETLAAMQTLDGNLNEGVPVIALTANAITGARETYLNAGFSDYLSKPVEGEKIERMIRTYLPEELVHTEEDNEAEQSDNADAETQVDGESVFRAQHSVASTENAFAVDVASSTSEPTIPGIDISAACENCGSKEVFEDVLKQFYEVLPENAAKIETYWQNGELKEYTVQVHALKSSARLIGATELSELAKELETSGNAHDTETINEKTPQLLSLYRSYEENLAPIFGENVNEKEDTRPEISTEELNDAFKAIREFADAFDYDSADGVMEMLSNYRIPENEKEQYEKVRKALREVDREKLLELIEE